MAMQKPTQEKKKNNELEILIGKLFPALPKGYFQVEKYLEDRFGILTQEGVIFEPSHRPDEKTKIKLEELKKRYRKIRNDIKEEIKAGRVEPEASINDKVNTNDVEEKKKILKGRIGIETKLRFMEELGLIHRDKKGERDYKVKKYIMGGAIWYPYQYFRIIDLIK